MAESAIAESRLWRPNRWRCLLLLIALTAVAAHAGSRLQLVANDDWEPYTGEDIAGQGIATEIVTTALRRAGYQTSVTVVPWARALALTYVGEADGIVAIWTTNARRDKILFSDAYLSNKIVLLHMRGKMTDKKTLADLTGLHIGAGRGYEYSDAFAASKDFYVDPVDHTLANLRKLSAGRVDLVIEDERIAKYMISYHGNEIEHADQIEFSSPPLFVLPLYFGVSMHRPDARAIVGKFNAALKSMQMDGTLHSIAERFH